MKLAIVLFLLIAIYSILGTVVPQGLDPSFYSQSYPTASGLLLFFQINRIYRSPLFLIMVLLFVLNLTGCTLRSLPGQRARMRSGFFPGTAATGEQVNDEDLDTQALITVLQRKGYRIETENGGSRAAKHRIGAIGSSVTHLGIIVIILGGFLGSLFATEGFFNLLPGDTKVFDEQGFSLRLEEFRLGFREDGSVSQYYSDLTVLDRNGSQRAETIWVNKPLNQKGLNFYQSSYGWASHFQVQDETESVVAEGWLRNGESYFYQPDHLTILLYGYFPDMVLTEQGEPITMTEMEENPFYAVILYHFNEHAGSYLLEPGQNAPHENITVVFDRSLLYTGITYRKDMGYYFVLLGSALLLIGLVLSFYCYPKFIYLEQGRVTAIAGKNAWGFGQTVRRYVNEAKKPR